MRIAIVLDETLGPGFLANAAACIASGLFNAGQDILGPEINGIDITYIQITKIPCLILKQNKKPWKELLYRAQKNGLKYMLFTKEAQSTTSYDEYRARVEGKSIEEISVIGIGVLGEEQQVTKFSGDLPLLR